jgi:hypothetical protein
MLCLSAAIPAGATVLNFDGPGASYGSLTNYGSNMPGTPDIAVSYSTIGYAAYMYAWPAGYGDLPSAAYPATNGYLADVTLTPQNGATLTLNSFDLAGYYETDVTGQTVEVLNSTGGILDNYSGTILGTGPTHSVYSPNITSTTAIQIVFGKSWDDGIDNINFSETPAITPEGGQSLFYLLMAGATCFGVMRFGSQSGLRSRA